VHEKFLGFINSGLEQFQFEDRIMQVSGHMFDVPEFKDKRDGIFLPFITSWGWGTWKRAWTHFDASCAGWESIKDNRNLRYSFDLDGTYDYSIALEQQMSGEINSWAVRWYWSVFKLNGYCLFPSNSYVNNIGFDDTATHGYISSKLFFPKRRQENDSSDPNDFVIPESFVFDKNNLKYVTNTFSASRRIRILKKIKRIQRFVKSLGTRDK
jgi:hypothetical protein